MGKYKDFINYFLKDPILTSKYIFYRKILKKDSFTYKGTIITPQSFYKLFYMIQQISERNYTTNFKGSKMITENEFIINTFELGKIYIKNNIMPSLLSDIGYYNVLNVKDKVILDIGAYIGDSALYFAKRGAKKVYAYEAVKEFYEIMLKNIELNNLKDKIIPINKGIDCDKGKNYIWLDKVNYLDSGLDYGDYEIETISIKDVFEELYKKEGKFVAKIDCEGCEYSLLCLPEEYLNYSDEYVIEIHGSPQLLTSKFLRNEFKVKEIAKVGKWIKVYYFYK